MKVPEVLSFDSVKLDLDTGDVNTKVTTGKIFMTNVQCKNFISKGDTGKLEMTNVFASEKFDLKRSTGDIIFNQCDAESIFVETDTGDVTGSFLSDKIFFTDTDTGDVDVPKSMTGGRCEITTDTGDILIHIGGEEE